MNLEIAYVGDDFRGSTSFHRASALNRLGHNIRIINPSKALQNFALTKVLNSFNYRSGYIFVQKRIRKYFTEAFRDFKKIDLIWINSGELLGPQVLKDLRVFGCPVVLYINDDPTGPRDGMRFFLLKKSIKFYDLCVVVRNVNTEEFLKHGAKRVFRVYMSYDEIDHSNLFINSTCLTKFTSDVLFVGAWIPGEKRDEFILGLIKEGINVTIWGDHWQKCPNFKQIKQHWKGTSIYGEEYVKAINGAKICLGLLSKLNRDQHTQRSCEIPFAGGLLLAERTPEHLKMYKEGRDAVFWSSLDECVQHCRQLLSNEKMRFKIASNGHERIKKLGLGNENVCQSIINAVYADHKKVMEYAKYPFD